VNDNAPIFDNNATYEIRVPEDLPAGSTVQKVRAKDADAGLNGAITYSFSPLTERQHGKIFGIRPDTGKIYVKPAMQLSSPPFSPMDPWSSAASSATGSGALDHEAASVHLLSVVAVDRGQDPLTAHATVIVRVDDVNDNSPNIRVNTLVQPSAASGGETSGVGRPVASVAARAQLVENAAPGTFVAYVSVSDPDSGDYGRFWCSVTTSGLGGLRSENDVNDYPFALRQTFPPSDFQLVAVISLDREQQAAYDVTITCSDAGGRTSTSVVRVEVVDENDNGPVFSRESRYEFEIEENCPIGTIVGRVSASDIDDGPNAEVEYRLSGPELLTNRFVIDRRSGSISTRDDIDREYLIRESTAAATDNSRSDVNSDALKLTVVASDGGTPHRTSTADIIIHIGDVDDERPTFDAEQYTFHVAENQPSGATVGRVHAIDRDMPPNNRFRYFLTDHRRPSSVPSVGDSSVYFDVDELTGVLSTRIEFNRERIAEYHFDVVAKPDVVDDGTAGFETIVCVTVLVDDVNDVSPMFVSPLSDNQTILVSSRAPKRHVITTLRAVDHDAPGSHNSALTYGIISGGELLFAVNPHNGKLWVTGYLGDIVMREFLLRLIVSDNGLPFARNDTTELRIVVSRDVAYVPYPVDPYDDEITSDKYKLQDQYGGVLASEATAAVLAVALAIILTAIFVVAVTICVVRHRARSRRGILLVADGPRCTSADCCDEKDKRRHRAKSDKNGGLRGRPSQSAGDGQPRGMTEFTSTMTDADGMVSAARQSGGCAGHDVTTSGTLMPLVNGAAVTSLDISHLPDGDLMSVHQVRRSIYVTEVL
jgi:protocadherin delta 1